MVITELKRLTTPSLPWTTSVRLLKKSMLNLDILGSLSSWLPQLTISIAVSIELKRKRQIKSALEGCDPSLGLNLSKKKHVHYSSVNM